MLAILLLLNACGFRPKGSYTQGHSPAEIYFQSGDPYSDLTRLIENRLRQANITLAKKPREDLPTLTVAGDTISRRTVSLYASGQAAEYELGYSLSYRILIPGEKAQRFTVNLHRDFLDNPQQALAKSREEELIHHEMRTVAADQIVRRVTSLEL